MSTKNKGFTLVEVIVILVILAILAALLIPALSGYIDRAKEKQLIAGCRSCVLAAQSIASEDYGLHGTSLPPNPTAVRQLAEVQGQASDISLEADHAAIASLTYTEGEDSVTYLSQPYPHYVFDAAISLINGQVWAWAQNYEYEGGNTANEWLTIDYGKQQPQPLTQQQLTAIFGTLQLAKETQYICPMAIYDSTDKNNRNLLNIQYVTPQNPNESGGQNRYQPTAFLIDGKTYISNRRSADGKVMGYVNAKNGYITGNQPYYFQYLMNKQVFTNTDEFVELITSGGLYVLAP